MAENQGNSIQATHAGKVDIQQNNIRLVQEATLNAFFSIAAFGYYGKTWVFVQDETPGLTDKGVVVNDNETDLLHRIGFGF
jgi:hypothetical protein